MTGTDIQEVLIASHIKPWAACTNKERLSQNNCLMLSATYDKLFDCGLIIFNSKGELKVFRLISKKNLERLHLKNGTKYDLKCNEEKITYLNYHEKYIFMNN